MILHKKGLDIDYLIKTNVKDYKFYMDQLKLPKFWSKVFASLNECKDLRPFSSTSNYNFLSAPIWFKGTTINDLGGGGGNFRNEFIFSREPLPYKKIFLGIAFQNLFFPRQGLSKFIFSSARPLKIYFFLGEASQKKIFPLSRVFKIIFFPKKSLSKKISRVKNGPQFFLS